MKLLPLLFALLLPTPALADIYATQEGNATVIWQNKCKDLDPNDVYRTGMNEAEYIALTERWACLNSTQAAQSPEILKQIKTALKNTGYKKKITIYSIDPIVKGKYTGDFDNDNVSYTFGAWVRNGKLYYAAMNDCPNARRVLERLLRARR